MTDDALVLAQTVIESGAKPIVQSFFDQVTFTATHVVHDPVSRHAAIIDPVLDFDPASGRTRTASAEVVAAYIEELDIGVTMPMETHDHADHLSAAPWLQARLGGRIVIGRDIVTVQRTFGDLFNEPASFARDGSQFDLLLGDGDDRVLGTITGTALYVPGHTQPAACDNPRHIQGDLAPGRSYAWEQHSEACGIALVVADGAGPGIALEWISGFPGQVIRATRTLVVTDETEAGSELANMGFTAGDVVSCHVDELFGDRRATKSWGARL